MQGDGGLKLQYTHCRLCSLEERNTMSPAVQCHPEALLEAEAQALITELAK
jgi:arginyl-tRNA synthetase